MLLKTNQLNSSSLSSKSSLSSASLFSVSSLTAAASQPIPVATSVLAIGTTPALSVTGSKVSAPSSPPRHSLSQAPSSLVWPPPKP